MRELKFRAWDKQKEEMLHNGFILVPTTPNWSASIDRGSIELETWYDKFLLEKQGDHLGSGGIWIGEGADYYAVDNLTVMQFTGLTDKNGVELYEDDIVNGAHFNGSYAYGKIVFWCGEWTIEPIPNIEGTASLYESLKYGIEKIGTIHENPELLK